MQIREDDAECRRSPEGGHRKHVPGPDTIQTVQVSVQIVFTGVSEYHNVAGREHCYHMEDSKNIRRRWAIGSLGIILQNCINDDFLVQDT
ncbi:hypothetical protein GDO81_029129 [Engystomops pustulosus]|uniref:Uncharacterized protein n=1 Tax=Engystomops pustulosus TaxID=76066 RepID=A0AAV6YZ70_ENGPU|nr:hypothetical protein GDO81_029129 [Engystomops pustulosus]